MRELSRLTTQGNALEAGFGTFREMLRYKLARQGKQLIVVDRYYPSTRICHMCGYTMPEGPSLKCQTWVCPKCGKVHEREVNAAKNIKQKGLARFCA